MRRPHTSPQQARRRRPFRSCRTACRKSWARTSRPPIPCQDEGHPEGTDSRWEQFRRVDPDRRVEEQDEELEDGSEQENEVNIGAESDDRHRRKAGERRTHGQHLLARQIVAEHRSGDRTEDAAALDDHAVEQAAGERIAHRHEDDGHQRQDRQLRAIAHENGDRYRYGPPDEGCAEEFPPVALLGCLVRHMVCRQVFVHHEIARFERA